MKKTDKLLLGIVVGIVLLVLVTFVVALNKPKPTYQPEDTPDGVAFNYLFALQQKDYERAYEYLSASVRGRPRDANAFADDIQDHSWIFRNLESSSTTLEVDSFNVNGKRADVKIRETRFYEGDLFNSNQYSNLFNMTLRQNDDGEWKIEDADDYWVWCWDDIGGCK